MSQNISQTLTFKINEIEDVLLERLSQVTKVPRQDIKINWNLGTTYSGSWDDTGTTVVSGITVTVPGGTIKL